MAASADWTGGSSYFALPPGTLSELAPFPSDSTAPLATLEPGVSGEEDATGATFDDWWNAFWDSVGVVPGVPDLSFVGPTTDAIGGGLSSAASAVSGAVSEAASTAKSFGVWLIVLVGLLVVGIVAWKV